MANSSASWWPNVLAKKVRVPSRVPPRPSKPAGQVGASAPVGHVGPPVRGQPVTASVSSLKVAGKSA